MVVFAKNDYLRRECGRFSGAHRFGAEMALSSDEDGQEETDGLEMAKKSIK
jgi:hypothetical protein